jgi:phospholipase A1/A2
MNPQTSCSSLLIAVVALACCAPAHAQVADSGEIAACRAIVDPVDRAGCYDLLFGRPGDPAPVAVPRAGRAARDDVSADERRDAAAESLARDASERAGRAAADPDHTAMAIRWELDAGTNRGLWLPRGHRRTYILPAKWTSENNEQPQSPTQPAGPVPVDLTPIEAKFQLSLKLKAADDVFGSKADVWVGYTQQSYWQLYNGDLSRPFRETNYEPELFATIPMKWDFLGLKARMLNVGLVHQSNGRSNPLSRSWNRVYAQLGFERGSFSLLVRPWVRLHEESDDNNPDIISYANRGEIVAAWQRGERTLALTLRNSFSGSWRNYAQLDYSFPVFGNLSGYLQVTNGYGESLIDYNHNQTTIGVGVLVVDLM